MSGHALWIEELVGSDLEASLEQVVLDRDTEGSVVLGSRRGRPRRDAVPPLGGTAVWSSTPPRG